MMALAAQRLSEAQLYSAAVLVDITPKMEPAGVKRIVGFMLAHPDGFANLDQAGDAIEAYRPNKPRPADLSGLEKTLRQTSDGRWHWRWDIRFLTSKFQLSEDTLDSFEPRRQLMAEQLMAGAKTLSVPTLIVRGD